MRASRTAGRRNSKTLDSDRSLPELHISGAEGIYPQKDIAKIVREYTLRALSHQKGSPDRIVISVQELARRPLSIQSLPIATVECRSPLQSRSVIQSLLGICGVSEKAIKTSLSVTGNKNSMRGASLVFTCSGTRVEPDRTRGIRASRLGITSAAGKILSRKLGRQGINTSTVREALILASKVATCPQVVAELCVSDDPGYTTGYVASRKFGYIRIPHIKRMGERRGGRVFFLEEDAAPGSVTEFLEKTPALITGISPVFGIRSLNEIIDYIDR